MSTSTAGKVSRFEWYTSLGRGRGRLLGGCWLKVECKYEDEMEGKNEAASAVSAAAIILRGRVPVIVETYCIRNLVEDVKLGIILVKIKMSIIIIMMLITILSFTLLMTMARNWQG